MKIRRIIALLLCLSTLCLCSCGSTSGDETDASGTSVFDFKAPEITTSDNSAKNAQNTETDGASTAQRLSDAELALNERDYYTDAVSGKGGSVTLMLYICGSDLESDYGCATSDLNEILYSSLSNDKVNIIAQTGGTSEWQNSVLSSDTCQRFKLTSDGVVMLDEKLGQLDMTAPETLSSFIAYSAESFPADRYILVLWDHGGGTVGGFGYDENYPDSSSMSLAGLDQALYDGGVKFDMIGFDACLMATAECAFVMERYADFLIASQDPEPGSGWYYTNWINELEDDPSIGIDKLSQVIIDDFISNSIGDDVSAEVTLSAVDLTKLYGLYQSLYEYLSSASEALGSKDFVRISRARYDAGRGFENDSDHIDLITLAENLGLDSSDKLASAVGDCVVYQSSRNVNGRNGLNIYFPYNDIGSYSSVASDFADIGMGDDYVSFMSAFVTVMAGGQSTDSSAYDDYSDSAWFDESFYDDYGDYYNEYYYDSDSLEVIEKGDDYVLELTEDDWDIITSIELQVMFDDGEGYVDLGSDNVWETDDDGALIITFDNTWVALDGEYVCFYYIDEVETDDGWSTSGYVPVLINGEYAELIVKWDSWHDEGYVAGYRKNYDSNVSQKGLFQLADGDTIQYVCDYYDYDMNYDDTYAWGDEFVFDGELSVSYEDIGYGDCIVVYALTDVYGNVYHTEPVLFYDE